MILKCLQKKIFYGKKSVSLENIIVIITFNIKNAIKDHEHLLSHSRKVRP